MGRMIVEGVEAEQKEFISQNFKRVSGNCPVSMLLFSLLIVSKICLSNITNF